MICLYTLTPYLFSLRLAFVSFITPFNKTDFIINYFTIYWWRYLGGDPTVKPQYNNLGYIVNKKVQNQYRYIEALLYKKGRRL